MGEGGRHHKGAAALFHIEAATIQFLHKHLLYVFGDVVAV